MTRLDTTFLSWQVAQIKHGSRHTSYWLKNGQQLYCVRRSIDNSTIIMISHVNRFESVLTEISREPSLFSLSNACRIQSYKMSFFRWKSIQYDTTNMKFIKIRKVFRWYYSQIIKIEFNQINYQIRSSKHSTERNLSLHNSRNDKCRDKMWDFLMPRKRAKSFCVELLEWIIASR